MGGILRAPSTRSDYFSLCLSSCSARQQSTPRHCLRARWLRAVVVLHYYHPVPGAATRPPSHPSLAQQQLTRSLTRARRPGPPRTAPASIRARTTAALPATAHRHRPWWWLVVAGGGWWWLVVAGGGCTGWAARPRAAAHHPPSPPARLKLKHRQATTTTSTTGHAATAHHSWCLRSAGRLVLVLLPPPRPAAPPTGQPLLLPSAAASGTQS